MPSNQNDAQTYGSFKAIVEARTGFKCYESQPGEQAVWFGTSDMYNKFVTEVGDYPQTGTIAFLMDTNEQKLYSAYKKQWY